MLFIPTDFNGNAHNSQKVNIEGVSVSMRFLWNERESSWFCDFESVNGGNYGVQLKPGRLILSGYNRVMEGGDFVILKTEKANQESLGFENMGSVYKLYFVNDDDITVLENAEVI